MQAKKSLLVCVVGPTAIGKTSLAIAIAKAFKTEILSADSRQFYKEMTIGTAVPTPEELSEAPHHFIQQLSIFDSYSVGDFEKDALTLLDELFTKHPMIVMVGGSGLYVDAVVKGLDQFPEVPTEIRSALNDQLQQEGITSLQEALEQADPEYYAKVDIHNPHRLIRALEVFQVSGKPYSSFLGQAAANRPFEVCYIGLDADREIVYDRINRRVDLMVAGGLVEEAKTLYPHRDLNALQTVGYRELFVHFDGEQSLEEALEEIKKNTRRFAKRQNTWFKKNTDIQWFDYQTPSEEIIQYLQQKTSH